MSFLSVFLFSKLIYVFKSRVYTSIIYFIYIYGCRYWEAFNSEFVTGMTEEVQIMEIVI